MQLKEPRLIYLMGSKPTFCDTHLPVIL
ncbi:hypothetical protein XBP1_2100020 [Xenorhabdus bovienii str. puntauvense]|uniref:Uncharacterized protein n=1 Tax=Xenorhabdus bovienii str. puntauvense TaxID=1398201 RepID=A0A077NBZ1_XENBV|nr:hypothetical protein XBP1_2100020 [Xenorhabdus bovienii str. puntauvense]